MNRWYRFAAISTWLDELTCVVVRSPSRTFTDDLPLDFLDADPCLVVLLYCLTAGLFITEGSSGAGGDGGFTTGGEGFTGGEIFAVCCETEGGVAAGVGVLFPMVWYSWMIRLRYLLNAKMINLSYEQISYSSNRILSQHDEFYRLIVSKKNAFHRINWLSVFFKAVMCVGSVTH